MLPTYIKDIPPSKFILIEDNVATKAEPFITYLINHHSDANQNHQIHYCEFEFNRTIRNSGNIHKVQHHDFINLISDDADMAITKRLQEIANNKCVIILDSLAHIVAELGLHKTYKLMSELIAQKNVIRIIAVLHSDLIGDNEQAFKLLHHLSTLHIVLSIDPIYRFPRVAYTYKKLSGKVLTDTEQYTFTGGNLTTKPIEKLDVKKLVQTSIVAPEKLSTFKIGLNKKDMKSKEGFVLPYVPQEGNIFYEVDEADDWDEEDPDDDLDI